VTVANLSQTAKKYLPIYLESLRIDSVVEFDLFKENGVEVVLYRAASQPFTEKERRTLLDNNVTRLLVNRENRRQYQRYLEDNLGSIVMDPSIKESVRAGIVYDSAKLLMEDLFERPALGENIQRSKELVGSTVGFVLTGQAAFHSLLKVMSFDYSTYTHSVNVCTLSLALAQFSGLKNPRDLRALGTGALLHDIGKTRVSDSILNKIEPLTDAEMDLIRKHPEWGCDIIKQTDLIDPDSYYPILQHHERENNTGYPEAMSGSRIHLYGKITAIADVFDAMTTRRVYRSAMEAYPALKEMFADAGAFDARLLEQFTKMLGPANEAD
jgi:putative nucleotidyltransferase with HDIG domain